MFQVLLRLHSSCNLDNMLRSEIYFAKRTAHLLDSIFSKRRMLACDRCIRFFRRGWSCTGVERCVFHRISLQWSNARLFLVAWIWLNLPRPSQKYIHRNVNGREIIYQLSISCYFFVSCKCCLSVSKYLYVKADLAAFSESNEIGSSSVFSVVVLDFQPPWYRGSVSLH